jgi:two-component system, CAI-1 autoinducer sensor kinase/phosphatase CqsS
MNAAINPHPDSPPPSERLKAPGKAEKQVRILAVDDEPSLLKSTVRLLSRAGFAVTSAIDGVDALDKYAADRFDLVFSDFNMPRMNGLALLKELKAKNPLVKVVTYAGGLTTEQQDALRKAGVSEIIAKPAETAFILSVVKSALETPFECQEPLTDNISGATKALVRVLFVDDIEDIRTGMVDVGGYLGLDIKAAGCGNDAIAQFLQDKPDVVVSDFHMPEMNGLELLKAIKALDPKARVIILSAEASDEEKQALLDAGAFKVLGKPIDFDLFTRTVNAALAV